LAIALFIVWAPAVRWDQPELLIALAAIAGVGFFAELRLKSAVAVYFDATPVVALLALAIAGPLPALLVWAVPDAMSRLLFRQDRLVTPGMVITISSFALAVLAGEAVLQLASAHAAGAELAALYAAGLVMEAVNFAVAPLNFAPFYEGSRRGAILRAERDLAPALLAMLALGVAAFALLPVLGVFALALLAAVVMLPQLALGLLVRARSVRALSRARATELYSASIADALDLPERDRTIIACTAELLSDADPGDPSGRWRFEDVPEIVQAALHVDERWDGRGHPGGLPGAHTPLASRVVSVARAWSDLTAAGTVELSHKEAILGISTKAGAQFDPAIVEAAAQVVAEEQAFLRQPDFQPRLHNLPLPVGMRRERVPAALARLTQPA